MGLSGCAKCIKYALFAFNLLFWLLGCAILGIGLFIRFSPQSKEIFDGGEFRILNSIQHTGAYILIAMGAIMMIVGFMGCCGAIRENQCLLILFFISLLIIFCTLLAAGIWAFIVMQLQEEETKEDLNDTLMGKVKAYPREPEFMDNLQIALGCCGATDSSTYLFYNIPIPESCGDPIVDTVQQSYGCSDAIMATFRESVIFIGAAGITVAVILLFGMVFSMCLVRAVHRGDMSV